MAGIRGLQLVAVVAVASARIGDRWGTNIHWTSENAPGEAAMLAEAFKVVRMDFTWGAIEQGTNCGTYDFSSYDGLLSIMKQHGLTPYWILDYGSPCYPAAPGTNSRSCDTPACIAAFGRFAAAAVAHFKGNGIIFECLNEPNGMGGDNATDITALCKAAGAPITAAGEMWVGPTTAGMDWGYLNGTFAAGILDAFTAVSVHPYRSTEPETVLADYVTLRGMIEQYAPPEKRSMPILSGEWGYTSALPPCAYGNRQDEMGQARYAARMWLTNAIAGTNVSILYDWRDDGVNATNCESNFGSVRDVPTGNASQPYPPKPMYAAAHTLQNSIGNAEEFSGQVVPAKVVPAPGATGGSPRPQDVFVLAFSGSASSPGGTSIAAWTNATQCATPQPSNRTDCGFSGISLDECSARGCCWDPNAPKVGNPQCYTGLPVDPPTVIFTPPNAAAGACWSATAMLGGPAPGTNGKVCAGAGGAVSLQLSDAPVYLV